MAPPLLVFDFPDRSGASTRRVFQRPHAVLEARTLAEVRPLLRRVHEAAREGAWAAGFVTYEAGPAFDPALAAHTPGALPLAWFALFDGPLGADALAAPAPGRFDRWEPTSPREAHRAAVAAIREAIARGETYQVNHTLRLRSRLTGDARGAYEALRAAQGAAFGAYLDTGAHHVLSASPELFFDWDGRRVTTRPMKGTARRGRWEEEDEARRTALARSAKDRAENVMIVDLLRNDLGRVARPGSVRPSRLFDVERYRTVWQLTSTVEAETREGVTLDDVFAALFPCGSITGAPKVATSRLIHTLEPEPREVYCGAIGIVSPARACFSVAIRTAWVDAESGEARYGTGGGITWDSRAADEYDEALAKAQVLTERWPAFELLETLRLEHGEYALLERHLERLRSSARYFGIPLDTPRVSDALEGHARAHPTEPRRVRLLVAQDGAVRVESQPLVALPAGPLPVALARRPVSRHDRFLFHKTTHRATYEAHRAEQPDVFDVLLWNEEGELTELTSGNLVVELDGRRLTPARECGMLAGTLREELLARGEISEAVLRREDLARATRVWFVNGVRGEVEVRLV